MLSFGSQLSLFIVIFDIFADGTTENGEKLLIFRLKPGRPRIEER